VSERTILAGDIGGTSTRLSLYAANGDALHPLRSATYPSRSAKGLEELLARFLSEGAQVKLGAAALAVAGPVVDGRCVATNLPWILDQAALGEAAKSPRTRLLNDLQALAFGVLFVPPEQMVSLNGLVPPGRGQAAVLAAGTGLGEAYLHWTGSRYEPAPSEGSHGEFGPRNEVELELSRYLIEKFGHPSTERVISGPGFSVLYDFLKESGREKAPPELEAELAAGDKNALISRHGVEGRHSICIKAMELFVDAYGAEAGNMALRGFATGGVFVGGGIAPKILPKLRDGKFVEAFESKGRFREFMKKIPLNVVLHEDTGLMGSAHYARMLL
jgi:glucokinase